MIAASLQQWQNAFHDGFREWWQWAIFFSPTTVGVVAYYIWVRRDRS